MRCDRTFVVMPHPFYIQPKSNLSDEEECVYVLEGETEATIGESVYQVKAGDFIGYRADGLAHKLFNTGNSIFKCRVVGQRLDHADYPFLQKRICR